MGCVARTGTRGTYAVLWESRKAIDHLEDLGIGERIILRYGTVADSCEYGSEPSRFIYCWEILEWVADFSRRTRLHGVCLLAIELVLRRMGRLGITVCLIQWFFKHQIEF
jgi:hypothetical protein